MSTIVAENFVTPNGTAVVPVGTVIMYYGPTAPTGYLECDGQSTSGYNELEELIGATTPDLRGEFVRGWSNGRNVDSGRTLGSTQASTATRQVMDDAFGNDSLVTTPTFYIGQQYASADTAGIANFSGDRRQANNVVANPLTVSDNVSMGAQDNDADNVDNWITYRPRNVALMYCIKY